MDEFEKKQLLRKYLDGGCSEEELRQVVLLRAQPGIEKLWDELITERSGSDWASVSQPSQRILDITAKRKAELLAKIDETEDIDRKKNDERPLRKIRILRYAAIWAGFIMFASITLWQVKRSSTGSEIAATIEKTNPQGVPVRYVLPDSSEVFLGAGSTLHYPEYFIGDAREIQLAGEAFFQVAHNPDKPFIIHTGHIRTKVLGTSFKVEALDGQEVMVAVATGKVDVSSVADGQTKSLALLTPGLKVTWNGQNGKAVQSKADIASLEQWKAGDMIFDEQLLGRVAGELERRYGVQIVFRDKDLANSRVGGTFSAGEPVTSILKMLSVVGEFSYENKDDKTFTIYR
ncbi:DUF4974 domain-containing protein [Parapedobacter sp. SGR-10]|uniref:FecR family protein n=1 Tax=Parapedobacter sp. SGR-10 TaxID=2710879 RepID=UPI0013D6F529|nr:FecR domain-containing protein [Parapedobacter sp. SGR-10]NGF55556.1 DUF4974 domain-containing protein [Parapedobacter sp. SGR-10]